MESQSHAKSSGILGMLYTSNPDLRVLKEFGGLCIKGCYPLGEVAGADGSYCGDWTVELRDGGADVWWTVDGGRWTVDGGRWTVDGGRWTVDGSLKIN